MPDISMCSQPSGVCAKAAFCRRHPDSGTKPSNWQSWSAFGPPDRRCEHFWLRVNPNVLPADQPDAQRASGHPTPGVTAADPRGGEPLQPGRISGSGRCMPSNGA